MSEEDSSNQDLELRLATHKKLDKLIRHISNVQEACQLLGKKLIDKGEIALGIHLVALGFIHDQSKFRGIEWEYLALTEEFNGEAKLAAYHHNHTNLHHPEAWPGGINDMPRLFVAEMTCDWYARSTEFGTDIREWVKEKALDRYNISPQGKVYKWVKEFLDLLLDKPFTQAPIEE